MKSAKLRGWVLAISNVRTKKRRARLLCYRCEGPFHGGRGNRAACFDDQDSSTGRLAGFEAFFRRILRRAA
jgi:hypothetical protein